jgi:hypothetical protein
MTVADNWIYPRVAAREKARTTRFVFAGARCKALKGTTIY